MYGHTHTQKFKKKYLINLIGIKYQLFQILYRNAILNILLNSCSSTCNSNKSKWPLLYRLFISIEICLISRSVYVILRLCQDFSYSHYMFIFLYPKNLIKPLYFSREFMWYHELLVYDSINYLFFQDSRLLKLN